MPVKIQSSYTRAKIKTITFMGDSLTNNIAVGVNITDEWAEQVSNSLRNLGCPVQGRNLGRAGNSTNQMVARKQGMIQLDVPVMGVILGGVNDPGNSINQATTQANIQTLGNTLLGAGTNKIVIVSAQYLNYSTGGDTTTVPYSTYVPIRAAQLAAANALASANPGKVIFCDLYAYMKSLITSGQETQGSFSWHFADGNQHFNKHGNDIVAAAVFATIQSKSDWITDLRS